MVKFGILTIYASLYFYETICPFLCVKGKRPGRNYHFIHAVIEMVHFFNPISTRGLFKRLFREQTLYLKPNLLSWSVGLCDKTYGRTVDGWISHKRLVIVCDISGNLTDRYHHLILSLFTYSTRRNLPPKN